MIGLAALSQIQRRLKEIAPRGERPVNDELPLGTEVCWVQITSTTQTDGRYPGSLYRRDGTAATFTLIGSAGGIWVDTPNAETLTTSTYYPARASGVKTDGKVIFDVISFGGSSKSYCLASRATNLTIPNGTAGTPTAVPMTSEDSASGLSLVTEAGLTGVIKIPLSTATFVCAANITMGVGTGDRSLHVYVYDHNPTALSSPARIYTPAPAAYACTLSCAGGFESPDSLAAYVQVLVSQASGGNLTLTTANLVVYEL